MADSLVVVVGLQSEHGECGWRSFKKSGKGEESFRVVGWFGCKLLIVRKLFKVKIYLTKLLV